MPVEHAAAGALRDVVDDERRLLADGARLGDVDLLAARSTWKSFSMERKPATLDGKSYWWTTVLLARSKARSRGCPRP
jgi:hypothetical protein